MSSSSGNPKLPYYDAQNPTQQAVNNAYNGSIQQANPKSASSPPMDYVGAAQQQAASGQQAVNAQTQANRPNQNTGFGSNQWTQNPDGSWTQNVGLNGPLSGTLGNLQQTALNNSQNGQATIAADRQRAIDANYQQATSRLNPQWDLRDEQLQTQLANQGLDPTSAAGRAAMLQETQGRNDAYSSAMANAIGLGNQTEAMDLQAQMSPYSQMGALQGYENNLPGFNAAGAWGPTNYMQAYEDIGNTLANNNQITAEEQGQMVNAASSMIGSILGAAGRSYSDERLKQNVHRLPVSVTPGVPLATFEYKGAPGQTHLGVIAQDVEKAQPDAVSEDKDGMKVVDYRKLNPFGVK